MKKLLLPLTFFLFTSSVVWANDHHEALLCSKVDKKEFTEKMTDKQDKFLKKLDLTKAQKNKINEIRENRSEGIFNHVQKIRTSHKELLTAIERNESDDKIREHYKALEKDKMAFMEAKLDQTLAIRASLNPSQRRVAVEEIYEKVEDMCD